MAPTGYLLVLLATAALPQNTFARLQDAPSFYPPETPGATLTTDIPDMPPPSDGGPSAGIIAVVIIVSLVATAALAYFCCGWRVWIKGRAAERETTTQEEEWDAYAGAWDRYYWDVYEMELENLKRWAMQRRAKAWGWG